MALNDARVKGSDDGMYQLTGPPGRFLQPNPPHVPHSASQQTPFDSIPSTPLLQTTSNIFVGVPGGRTDNSDSGEGVSAPATRRMVDPS